MTRAIIMIARNEGEWPRKTIEDFRLKIPDTPIIAVDDGGQNDLTGADYILDGGLAGVGKARRIGVEKAAELGADSVLLIDAHVFYKQGDIQKAWQLSESCIVNPTYESYHTGDVIGCGRVHNRETHVCSRAYASEGQEAGMYGSVYFLNVRTALDVVAPTPNHGANEQIMTLAAWTLGYRIYALPSLVFRHVYKQKLNYRISEGNQKRNKKLLRWWFFNWQPPENVSDEERDYKGRIERKRQLSSKELYDKIQAVNKALNHGE